MEAFAFVNEKTVIVQLSMLSVLTFYVSLKPA